MNAKKQLENMVGSDFMAGLTEMTSRLESLHSVNGTSTKLEVLSVDVTYDSAKNKLGADVWIYLGPSPEFSVVQVELFQGDISIAKNTLAATSDVSKNVIVSGAAKKEVKTDDITVHVSAVGMNQRKAAEVFDKIFTADYVLGMSDVVNKIDVQDPRNIKTPQGSEIHVSFDRTQQLQTVDYDYTQYRVDTGLQEAYLDMSGVIYLNNGYEYVNGSYKTDKIFLQSGDDIHVYDNSEATVTKIDSTTIKYQYNNKWNCTIPKTVKNVCSSTYLRSQATFKYKEKASGNESTCIVVVSSKPYSSESTPNNYKQIPKILFYWGCLEENTNITMADGTQKKIKEIEIGQKVLGTEQKACEVRNIIRGKEDMLIGITLESCKEILLTQDHPFKTKKGIVAAIDLKFGDEILTENGYKTITGARLVKGDFNVCSIDISPSDFIWANGIAVGDYEAQGNSIKALAANQKSAVSEKIEEECRKINKMYYQEF